MSIRIRKACAVAAGVTAVLTLGACSSGKEAPAGTPAGGDPGKVTLYYLQKQGDQQYFVDQATGAKERARELGVELKVVNLGTDANKAITEMDTAIAQGASGIAIVVPDQLIGPQVIDKAKSAGVPLVASDDVIKDASGKAAPFVGFNGTAMGTEVGKEAGRLFKQEGWTPADTRVLSVYKQDLSVCVDRVEAAEKSFTAEAGASTQVIKVGTDNSSVDAQNKTGAIISANPDVKHWVVWGCNDESETGAVTALANAGFGGDKVIGVGLGAYLTCKDWKAGQDTGNRAALFISGAEVGRSTVDVLVKNIRDKQALPAETIAKTSIVTKDNWEKAGVTCT